MIEYPKISGPYKRQTEGPDRNQLIIGLWTRPEFEMLADSLWFWTEKIDGTNIRIGWDGHKVTIGGRTDNAQLHSELVQNLNETFKEELFEQEFGSDSVMLYGEGCGPGIQKGGERYGDKKHFKLFDVQVGDWWLQPSDITNVAYKLGIEHVFLHSICSPYDAINEVGNGLTSFYGDFEPEGLVGVPNCGLLDRSGRRIQMKVKACDFKLEAEDE